MPNFKSDQKTKWDAEDVLRLKPSEYFGRLRVATFQYTIPAGGLASGDTLELCVLPKGGTIIGGQLVHDGIGNSIVIGTPENYEKYLTNTATASATTTPVYFAHTIALKVGQTLSDETVIAAKAWTGAWTAAKKLSGVVLFVLD
jgi:hypothetical protein